MNLLHQRGNTILHSMSKKSVVIIEDEFFAATHLGELLADLGYEVRGIFYSGESFLKQTTWDFDIAVVDIFLSDKVTGLDIAEKLNEQLKPFVFLTANQDRETLKTAARLAPKAYISKPFQPNDVQASLEIISYGLMPKIQVRTLHGIEELSAGDIVYIQSDGVYIQIKTTYGKITQRKLLKEIQDELPASFLRVHRSYLVNTQYIEKRTATTLTLKGKTIPISRSYRTE